MMYLVFLAILYKLQNGSFRSFVRAALGYNVEADRTPTTPTSSGKTPVGKKASFVVVVFCVRDSAVGLVARKACWVAVLFGLLHAGSC